MPCIQLPAGIFIILIRNIGGLSSIKKRYDDITIIDSFVVITSELVQKRDSGQQLKSNGNIWYFSKPTTTTTPLTLSSVNVVATPYTVTSPFLIKKCYANNFVTATKGGTGDIFVSEYSQYTLNGTVKLATAQSNLKDICYNIDDNTTDVMVDLYNYIPSISAVYTVLPAMMLLPGVAYGHQFNGYINNSLIYRKCNPHHYICTGYKIADNNSLYLHRYSFNSTLEDCSTLTSVTTSNINDGSKEIEAKLQYTVGPDTEQVNNLSEKSVIIETICGEPVKLTNINQ